MTPPLREAASLLVTPRGARYDLGLNTRGPVALRGGSNALVATWKQSRDGVRVAILANGEPTDAELDRAMRDAIGLAGLDDDPADFPAIAQRHSRVADLHSKMQGMRMTRVPTVFEAFAKAVVEQLVTWAEAASALRRIAYRLGEAVPGTQLRAFPTAKAIASMPPFELRACGVGLRRARTLLDGARRADALERLRDVPPEDAMNRIQSMRGVGIWTANKVAMNALGHADACLVGDAGAPFVATMVLLGHAGGDDEMLEALAPFRPHRARVQRLFDLATRHGGGLPEVPPRRVPRVDPHRREPWRTE